jgi:hypothetical protein
MMSNTNQKITVFLDYVGRSVFGEVVESEDVNILKIKNPVILHVPPVDQSGKMAVQLFPLFFREFLADKSEDVIFSYQKDKITSSNIESIDFRLLAQYGQLFNKNNVVVNSEQQNQQSNNSSNDVIKLFDE